MKTTHKLIKYTSSLAIAALAALVPGAAVQAASPDGLTWSAQVSGTTNLIRTISGDNLGNVIFSAGTGLYQYDAGANTWGELASWSSYLPTLKATSAGGYWSNVTSMQVYAVGSSIWVGGANGTPWELPYYNGTNWNWAVSGIGQPVRALYSTGIGAGDKTLASRNSGRLSIFTGTTHTFTDSTPPYKNAGEIYAMAGTGVGNIWAVGNNNIVQHSTDGGTSWTSHNAPSAAGSILNAVSVIDSTTLVVGGNQGGVFLTGDSGTSWINLNLGGSGVVRGIYAESTDRIWVVGDSGLASFYDGTLWSSFSSELTGLGSAQLMSIHRVEDQLWIGGANGRLFQAAIPEPSTLALTGLGLLCFALARKRRPSPRA